MIEIRNRILVGDARERLREVPDASIHCCVTSPPYFGLRSYLDAADAAKSQEIGTEKTPDAFIAELVSVFREVKRVLRDDGVVFINIGDSYSGSGRGGNPESGTKQGTNAGSQSVGVLYGRDHDDAERERKRIREGNARLIQSGIKAKDLIGIPWMLAFALRADGWYLRQEIIWAKRNPMPESVTDRPTRAHEQIFLLSKSPRYFYDAEAIKEPSVRPNDAQTFGGQKEIEYEPDKDDPNFRNGKEQWERVHTCAERRNKRSVWEVSSAPFSGAHFATFPPKLIEPCILAGCPESGVVLDPFFGAGTTGLVAQRLGRDFLGCELNPDYAEMARKRIICDAPMFNECEVSP